MKYYLLALVFLPGFLCCQALNYIHYNTNNSKLPHDIVYGLNQDSKGFLWISTDDGLVKFDGTEMVNIDKGFISSYVIGTDEERGKIWACTWKGGIHYIRNDSAILVNSLPDDLFAKSTNHILVFKDLIISHNFKSYMVYKYDASKNLLRPYSLKQKYDNKYLLNPPDIDYYQFIKSKQHRLYAYNKQGIFNVADGKLKKLNSRFLPDLVWESPSGVLYFQQGPFIYLTNPDFSTAILVYKVPLEKFKNKVPFNFRVLPSGNLCLGFGSSTHHNFNPVYYLVNTHTGDITDLSGETNAEALSADLITDREGSIWLSTDGHGLYHIFDQRYQQIGGNKLFNNPNITSLFSNARDSLYIGTKEGLYLFHHKKTEHISASGKFFVKKIFTTGDNGVALSIYGKTQSPAYKVNNKKLATLPYLEKIVLKDYILTFFEDGNIDVRDRNTFKLYDKKDFIFFIDDAEEDDRQVLWLCTHKGLYYFRKDIGIHKFRDVKLDNALINCLCFVAGKGLWLGTNKGLFLINNGISKHWGAEEGLINPNINCLFPETQNSLWIGAQNGLFHFSKDRFAIYKRRDGLIADDVSCLEAINDTELVVGSSKGLTFFLMKSQRQQSSAVDIEKVTVNNKDVNWHQVINVPYNNSIFFKYHEITFIYPELMVFEYRLHANEMWIATQNKTLIFTNLKPGDYHLELRVKKYNTGFSKPVLIHFNILQPWWRSSYFYAVIFIGCIALIYYFFNLRLNKHRHNLKLRQEIAELKMKALQAQLNPHFVSNTLNAIHYFILKQDEIAANKYLSQFADLTRMFLEVSRTRFVSLEMELQLLDHYLNLEQLRFENRFDFLIEIDERVDKVKTNIPGLLIQPFVENSINHGIVYLPKNKKGLITIHIKKKGNGISIVIDDNGIGRKKAGEIKNRQQKFSRSHSSEIVEELKQAYNLIPGCKIEIETIDKVNAQHEPEGTRVTINLDIKQPFTEYELKSPAP